MKRSKWIDKFLQSDKMKKLAFQVEANYLERLKRLTEDVRAGKTTWSSIDEALEDFASRNNFSRKQMKVLVKEAGADYLVEQMEEEGLGSQAVEYMSDAKNKHTEDSASPFVVNKDDKKVEKKIRQKEEDKRDLEDDTGDEENNEMKYLDLGASQLADIIYRYAQDGKIINLPGVDEDSMEELSKELKALDVKTPYQIVRHGFRFTGMKGELSEQGEPVKVTVYRYSFLKRRLADEINGRLREKLSQELPIEEWIQFLKNNMSPRARALQVQLERLQRDLFSEEAVYVETKKDRTQPGKVKKVMQMFPVSYQKEILRMLAEGTYRHMTKEEGREHQEIYATGYKMGSFVLMQSFDPYVKLVPKFEDAEQAKSFVKAVVDSGKNTFTAEEFEQLLNSTNVPYQEIPVPLEGQTLKLTKGFKLKVENKPNENYKPVTNQLTTEEMNDPEAVEKQLEQFQNQLAGVLMQDIGKIEEASETGKKVQLTPLAYEPQPDGSYKPLSLLELGDKDYTAQTLESGDEQVENPTAGVHPTYKGEFKQTSGKGKTPVPTGKDKGKWQDLTPTQQTEPKKKKEKPKPRNWEEFLSKSKNLKKFESQINRAIVRFAGLDVWVSDRGRIFSTEQAMKSEMYDTFVDEYRDDIIELAADQLSDFITEQEEASVQPEQAPVEEAEEVEEQQEVPAPTQEVEEVEPEQEQLPLAASSKPDFTKLSSQTKAKLARLYKKYERQ